MTFRQYPRDSIRGTVSKGQYPKDSIQGTVFKGQTINLLIKGASEPNEA